MRWVRVADAPPPREGTVVLATNSGSLLGKLTGFKADPVGGDSWSIDDAYYDGDDPPTWWLSLPEVPRSDVTAILDERRALVALESRSAGEEDRLRQLDELVAGLPTGNPEDDVARDIIRWAAAEISKRDEPGST